MITYFLGTISHLFPNRVILLVSDIGYEISISLSTFEQLKKHEKGESIRLLIHHVFREDGQFLYGFASEEQRETFRLLLQVDGIGPKSALSFGNMPVEEFKKAVATNDVETLKKIKGVGTKSAERVILELRDKIGASQIWESGKQGSSTDEAILALISLGYKKPAATSAVEKAIKAHTSSEPATSGELIRSALLLL